MGTFSNIASIFSDIADALRSKMGVADTFKPGDMAGAVNNIQTGEQVDEYVTSRSSEYVLGVTSINRNVVKYDVLEGTDTWNVASAANLFRDNWSDFSQYEAMYFGDNVTDMIATFHNCRAFNQPVTIGNNVTNMALTFYNCQAFNQPVTISDNVTNMYGTFYNCKAFNQPVTIGNNVTNMALIFDNCQAFNQPVTIPDNVISVGSAFLGCTAFNQPVTIPDKVFSMVNTFYNCKAFNQPVTIGNNVTNMSYTFLSCTAFNQPVTISDNVTNMHGTFWNCQAFNQPVTIGNNVTDVALTFYNCQVFSQAVYFRNSSKINASYAKNMFGGVHNNSLIRPIYCDNADPFLVTSSSNSITGTEVTWSALSDGNGYYNALYNIYIYNNWTPT